MSHRGNHHSEHRSQEEDRGPVILMSNPPREAEERDENRMLPVVQFDDGRSYDPNSKTLSERGGA
jgi:hypothetical protein